MERLGVLGSCLIVSILPEVVQCGGLPSQSSCLSDLVDCGNKPTNCQSLLSYITCVETAVSDCSEAKKAPILQSLNPAKAACQSAASTCSAVNTCFQKLSAMTESTPFSTSCSVMADVFSCVSDAKVSCNLPKDTGAEYSLKDISEVISRLCPLSVSQAQAFTCAEFTTCFRNMSLNTTQLTSEKYSCALAKSLVFCSSSTLQVCGQSSNTALKEGLDNSKSSVCGYCKSQAMLVTFPYPDGSAVCSVASFPGVSIFFGLILGLTVITI